MNKQAYEKSVGYVLSKQADFDWNGLWGGIKQHFKDNKQHYIRGAAVGLPAMILGGAFGGKNWAGLGALAGLLTGFGSKGWDWYKQSQQQQQTQNKQYQQKERQEDQTPKGQLRQEQEEQEEQTKEETADKRNQL